MGESERFHTMKNPTKTTKVILRSALHLATDRNVDCADANFVPFSC